MQEKWSVVYTDEVMIQSETRDICSMCGTHEEQIKAAEEIVNIRNKYIEMLEAIKRVIGKYPEDN